jgi:hypothetical protein
MEGNGGEHNLQRAAAALERAGARLDCPFCGNTVWSRIPNPVVLKEARPVVDEVGVPVAGDLVTGFSSYALICRNCGFVRLHAVRVLLG